MIADTLLEDIQPELADDPAVSMAMEAVGAELQRVADIADRMRDNIFPRNANDEFGILGIYEWLFGLPVAPPTSTVQQRQDLVLAHFRKRIAGTGLDWQDALTNAMGSTLFSYQEGPTPNTVTVRYAFVAGAPSSALVQSFVREITPAHVQVLATFSQGFIVGVSLVGDPL